MTTVDELLDDLLSSDDEDGKTPGQQNATTVSAAYSEDGADAAEEAAHSDSMPRGIAHAEPQATSPSPLDHAPQSLFHETAADEHTASSSGLHSGHADQSVAAAEPVTAREDSHGTGLPANPSSGAIDSPGGVTAYAAPLQDAESAAPAAQPLPGAWGPAAPTQQQQDAGEGSASASAAVWAAKPWSGRHEDPPPGGHPTADEAEAQPAVTSGMQQAATSATGTDQPMLQQPTAQAAGFGTASGAAIEAAVQSLSLDQQQSPNTQGLVAPEVSAALQPLSNPPPAEAVASEAIASAAPDRRPTAAAAPGPPEDSNPAVSVSDSAARPERAGSAGSMTGLSDLSSDGPGELGHAALLRPDAMDADSVEPGPGAEARADMSDSISELSSLGRLSSMGLDDYDAGGRLSAVATGDEAQQPLPASESHSSLSSLSAASAGDDLESSKLLGSAASRPLPAAGVAAAAASAAAVTPKASRAAAADVLPEAAEPHPAQLQPAESQQPSPAVRPVSTVLRLPHAEQATAAAQQNGSSANAAMHAAPEAMAASATTAAIREADGSTSSSRSSRSPTAPDTEGGRALPLLPPPHQAHLAALAQAEALERSLLTGPQQPVAVDDASRIASLRASLAAVQSGWPAEGRSDQNGNVIGGSVLVRVDRVPAFDSHTMDQQRQAPGSKTAVTAQRGFIAVGMSSGVIALQMPRTTSTPPGGATRATRVMVLGEARAGDSEAVTALAFSGTGSMLLAGHASGSVVLWEWHRGAWEAVKSVRDAHAAAVTVCVFLDSSSQAALTADMRGRLVFHNVSAYVSIMGRLTKAAAPVVLLEGRSLGPICSLTTLTIMQQAPNAQEAAAVESLVLVGGPQAIYACSVAPEGRLSILQTIGRPPDAPTDCSPYVAWHLKAPSPGATSNFVVAALAMAWDRRIVLVDVPVRPTPPLQGRAPETGGEETLLRSVMGLRAKLPDAAGLSSGGGGGGGGGGTPAGNDAGGGAVQPALPPVQMVHMWSAAAPVTGIAWLAARRLAVISGTATDATLRLYSGADQVLETAQLGEPLVGRSLGFGSSGALQTVFHNALSTRGGRLVLLCHSGVRLVRQMVWPDRISTLCTLTQWPLALDLALQWHAAAAADGGDDALAQAAGGVMKALQGHIDSVLAAGSLPDADPAQTATQLQVAAEVAIQACVLAERLDVLWGDLFPRFQAFAATDAFLAALQPHILADEVPSPAPEVVQALVEYCAVRGQPDQVERCVLHMNIASLDFSQVVKLCRMHRLYSALTYILTRGLDDYVAPAVELLLALADASGAQRDTGFKLLVYLRCCLRQQQFPPGAGPLPTAKAGVVKAGVLGLLLFAMPGTMLQMWRSLGGGGGLASLSQEDLQQALPGPHPALRRLVAVDAAAALAVLQEGLVGWDALESDLLEAAASVATAPPGGTTARSATQAVADAVAALLDAGAFGERASTGVADADQQPPAASDQTAWALDFLATHLGDGRATAAPGTVMQVLGYLAAGPWLPGQAAQAAELREQRFINVVKHASTHTPDKAARLGEAEMARVGALALRANFLRAEAETLHQAGNYAAAIARLLRSPRGAAGAVRYIEDTLDDVYMGSPRRAGAFRTAVLQAMPQLTEADAAAAAGLVLRRMPREHAAIVHSMGPQPELQYKYLKGALEVAQGSESDARPSASVALAALDRGDLGNAPGRNRAAAVHHALMAREDSCELYVRLLCQYEPRAVLPFLQSHTSYRVNACMEWCREAGVHDAEAYLLEHYLGDYAAALRICLEHVDRCNRQLVEAVKTGGVTLATSTRLRSGSMDVGALFHGSGPLTSPSAASRSLRKGPDMVSPAVAMAAAARQAAVDLCQRCALDAASDLKAEDLWFPLLQCYIKQLQELRRDEQQLLSLSPLQQMPSPSAASSGASAAASLPRLRSIDPSHSPLARAGSMAGGGGGGPREQLQALQALFTSFMEVIISQMAGYIPLQTIGDRLLGQLEVQRWGECRGTLLGLLAAYNYEAGILAAAARLLCGDAARDLVAAYRTRLRARPAPPPGATTGNGSPKQRAGRGTPSNGVGGGFSGSGSNAGSPKTAAAPVRMAAAAGPAGSSIGGGGSSRSGGGAQDDMRRKLALLELFDTRPGAAADRRS